MDTYKHDSRLQSSGALLLPKTGRIICKKKGGKERDAVVNDSKQILNCSLGRLYSSPLFTETWHCVCQHSWRPALSLSKTLVTTTMTRTWCIYNTHIYKNILFFLYLHHKQQRDKKIKEEEKREIIPVVLFVATNRRDQLMPFFFFFFPPRCCLLIKPQITQFMCLPERLWIL